MLKLILTPILTAALAFAAASLRAQNYEISWYTIDGGGGTSTGGNYSLTGTIGQPDAGVMSGGSYTLVGGFWGVVAAIQTPGAPLLSITRAAGSVLISWPAPSTGFILQENPDLNTGNWTAVSTLPTQVGDENQVTVPSPIGNRYYRLEKPAP